jgi:aspartate carbamoyltransferase regulatory subunit
MENNSRKELVVSAIENGTVIDHIPVHNVFQVVRLLGLDNCPEQILFGTNLESRKYGKKGIIKVNNKFFEHEDINKIALVAPTATLIVIKDFQVVEKKRVEVPDHVEKVVKCVNPNCVTNIENVPTKFVVINKTDVKLRCHYCEKITDKRNMGFK